jgi:hypothetical protein
MKIFNFFLCLCRGSFLLYWIRIANPDPDLGTTLNPDPIRIRIHNTGSSYLKLNDCPTSTKLHRFSQCCGSASVSMRIWIREAKPMRILILVELCRHKKLNWYMKIYFMGLCRQYLGHITYLRHEQKPLRNFGQYSCSWTRFRIPITDPDPGEPYQCGSGSTRLVLILNWKYLKSMFRIRISLHTDPDSDLASLLSTDPDPGNQLNSNPCGSEFESLPVSAFADKLYANIFHISAALYYCSYQV